MKKKHLSRRDFSKAVGAAALFAPFVSMLRQPRAQTAGGRAKYLLIFVTNGTDVDAWSPVGSTATNVRHSVMTEKLAPLAPNLVLVEKLSSRGTADNHGAPGGLTGLGYSSNNHTSLDGYVADGLRAAGVRTPIPSLILGSVQNERHSTFYRDGQNLSPIYSPLTAYDTVFGGATPTPGGGGGGGGNDAEAAQILRRRQSALDLMRGELTTLRGKLGSQERVKLDLHAESFRQLEERLTGAATGGGGGGECTVPGAPGDVGQDLLKNALNLDIGIQALACDITRVVGVRFGHHQSTQISLPEIGDAGDWHNSFIHGDNPRQRLINLERWLCDRFVDAANRLKALPAPDGDGSLFDQTLMVWARDMGDAVSHNGENMRFVFSGGAGGYLNTSASGRYIDGTGSAHQQALINCCEAMGVNPSGFADPNGPRSPLSGIGG